MPTAPSLGTHRHDHGVQLCPRALLQAFLRAGLLFNLPLGLTINRVKPSMPCCNDPGSSRARASTSAFHTQALWQGPARQKQDADFFNCNIGHSEAAFRAVASHPKRIKQSKTMYLIQTVTAKRNSCIVLLQ